MTVEALVIEDQAAELLWWQEEYVDAVLEAVVYRDLLRHALAEHSEIVREVEALRRRLRNAMGIFEGDDRGDDEGR